MEPAPRNIVTEIHALEEKLSTLRRELFAQAPVEREGELVNLLLFRVGGKIFGLFLSDVVEVLRMVKSIALPKAPPDVQGVVNCRGVMVPLLNPGLMLAAEPVTAKLTSNLVVVMAGGQQIALLVDTVETVRTVKHSELKLDGATQSVHRTMPVHFAGYLRSEEGNVFILDVEQVLNSEDRKSLGQALRVRDEWGQG